MLSILNPPSTKCLLPANREVGEGKLHGVMCNNSHQLGKISHMVQSQHCLDLFFLGKLSHPGGKVISLGGKLPLRPSP